METKIQEDVTFKKGVGDNCSFRHWRLWNRDKNIGWSNERIKSYISRDKSGMELYNFTKIIKVEQTLKSKSYFWATP